jgi:uncharacterized protein (DUF433 family)
MLITMNRRVVSDPAILSGTPVFRGTRIPLDHVAGLIRKGISDSELGEEFPSLTKVDLEYARAYARQSKRPGRPRKPLELRRTTKAA